MKYLFIELVLRLKQIFLNSFSQDNEDLIVDTHLSDIKNGHFIDIGCNHPKRFNNTYRFYLKGWRGLNIDPNPSIISYFNKVRPQDINLNIGINDKKKFLTFYEFFPNTISTFDYQVYKRNLKHYVFKRKYKVKTIKLSDLLIKYPNNYELLSIDTEGYDMKVLKSNNWNTFRPRIIIVENKNRSINTYLQSKNYKLLAQMKHNGIYKKN